MNIDSAFNTAASSVANHDTATKPGSRKGRYFFVAMAILFPIITALGFGSDYMLISANKGLTVHWFALVHGAIMSGWLLIFFVQSVLAAYGNLKFHRQLGLFSVGLGIIVWLSMVIATIRPFVTYAPPVGAPEWDGLLIQLYGIILFGILFTWGILVRKKATVHKRLLLLATMVLMQAGIDRIPFLPGLGVAIFVRFIYLDTLIIPLLIYDLVTIKRIHKMTVIGSLIIIIVQFSVTMTFGSSGWHQFGFNSLAPFVEKEIEIKLSDAKIEPLLGVYGDKKWHLTVRRDSGKIYLQLPNVPRFEMAPTAENEWSLKTMTWRVSFIRAPDGSVIKIINKQPSVTWEVKRLK